MLQHLQAAPWRSGGKVEVKLQELIGKYAEHERDGFERSRIDKKDSQATGSARQFPDCIAQVTTPASTIEDPTYSLVETIQPLSQLTHTANRSLSCNSDHQDAVLPGRYPETFRIASVVDSSYTPNY